MKAKLNIIQLVEEAKKLKPQAQNKIVNIFWNDVKEYIFFRVKDTDTAEELTIKTFTKVLGKLDLYNSDFDFRTWIISIAHNTAIDYLRKKNKDRELYSDDTYNLENFQPSPEEAIIERQDMEELEKCIKKLPVNYEKLIRLRYLDGKKINDIAIETNLSVANVKVSLMRAKKLLIEILSKR